MAIDQMKSLLSRLAQNPQAVDKLAMALAQRGAAPPDIRQIDALKQQLAARRRMVPPAAAMGAQAARPSMPVARGQAPVVTPVSPQQSQAVNQQLGIVKGQNPYLMR